MKTEIADAEDLVLKRFAELGQKLKEDSSFMGRTRLRLKSQPIQLPIGINPSTNGRILVHMPGCEETADGYGMKYRTLATFLQEKELCAVVRMDNQERDYHPYEQTLHDDLRFVIDYALKNSERISGSTKPELYLMGFSGGAEAVGVVAHEFPVSKILLMGPGLVSEVFFPLKEGLGKFLGEVYIAQGEQDHVRSGRFFYNMATHAKKRELAIVPNCDHQFRHEVNDRVYSKAPFWAIAGDTSFPSPEGGIRLVQK